MKRILLAVLMTTIFFSCKKDEPDANVLLFMKLIDKVLVCDSIKTNITDSISTVQVIGRGQGEDLQFNNYAGYTKFSTPVEEGGYQLTPPTKLYMYTGEVDLNDFFTILSITDKKLVLRKRDPVSRRQIDKFYTAFIR